MYRYTRCIALIAIFVYIIYIVLSTLLENKRYNIFFFFFVKAKIKMTIYTQWMYIVYEVYVIVYIYYLNGTYILGIYTINTGYCYLFICHSFLKPK